MADIPNDSDRSETQRAPTKREAVDRRIDHHESRHHHYGATALGALGLAGLSPDPHVETEQVAVYEEPEGPDVFLNALRSTLYEDEEQGTSQGKFHLLFHPFQALEQKISSLEQESLEQKINSLEQDSEKQDQLFEEHIKQLEKAKTREERQVALKDVMQYASSAAALSAALIPLYKEMQRIEDQLHLVDELAKLQDEGRITSDQFEQKKKEILGLREDPHP